MATETRPRFQVRASTYRGKDGFLITGNGRGIFCTRIFTLYRSSAERIVAKLRENPRYFTTLEDFAE